MMKNVSLAMILWPLLIVSVLLLLFRWSVVPTADVVVGDDRLIKRLMETLPEGLQISRRSTSRRLDLSIRISDKKVDAASISELVRFEIEGSSFHRKVRVKIYATDNETISKDLTSIFTVNAAGD